MLSRRADLLATLAYVRNGDATAIKDASQNPGQFGDCDLLALADRKGKIIALQTTTSRLSIATAEKFLRRSFNEGSGSGWWFDDGHLFQVVLQPYYEGEPGKSRLLGTVVVGRELDATGARDLARISSSHLIFRYGNDFVMSTFSFAKQSELEGQLRDRPRGKEIRIGDERFFTSSLTLDAGAQPALSLTVLKSHDEATASLKRLNRLLIGLGLAAVLGGGILVFVISDRSTRPLAYLADGVRALEQGDFVYPLKSHGGDEVARVTRAFEDMRNTLQRNEEQRQQHEVQRQQLEGQLRQAQKMDAMGRLAGGVAHDFNNLLTVIKGNSSLLVERLQSDDQLLGRTQQIENAADRAASLTRQLLAFCRMQVLQPKILDLNMLVSEMCKLLRRLIREDIAFAFHASESLGRVKADPGQIEQVIMNLVVNAGDAMPSGGTLTIETRNVTQWMSNTPWLGLRFYRASMFCSRLRTLVMEWMPKRSRAFSSHSSLLRSRAKELDWDSLLFTASLSRASAAFGWSLSRRRGRDSKSTSHESTRLRSLLSVRELRSLLFGGARRC